MRIVSLCPSNTEILACLGLTKQIVGVDHYSDWPNEVQYLPNLGSELQINMEKVKKLEPDLIVASLSVPGMEKVVEEVKMLPFPYLVLDPHSIQDIYETIETVGVATDRVQEAQQLIAAMKSQLKGSGNMSKN